MRKVSIAVITAIVFSISTLAPINASAEDAMAKSNQFWWPQTLDLGQLRSHDARSNPYGDDFDYAEAFNNVDLQTLKNDIETTLTTSQD